MKHSIRIFNRAAGVAAVLLVLTPCIAAGEFQQPRLERVYYDGIDENGRLVGGSTLMPMMRPAWSIKPRGTVNNRVDIVIVGDGYQAGEQATFHSHADFAMATMFGQEPFHTYQNLFAVHQVEVVSIDSGVDNDPTQGILRNTAMNMKFWCSGTERLLCVNVNKAWQFASAGAPDVDLVLAVANSTKYGGAGYPDSDLATSSGGNGSAPEIAIHEFGHALGNLADEYDYGGPDTYTGPEPTEPDISILTSAQMASAGTKWATWLGMNDAAYDGLQSTYEGANYSVHGIYRPSFNSKMRALGRPFNHPSAEALIIEIYKIVRPIDDATPTGQTLNGNETVFVDPVDPIGNPLAIQWTLDGNVLPGSPTTMDLAAQSLSYGAHQLSVSVVDPTTLVRDETARGQWMTDSRTWNINVALLSGDINCDHAVNGGDASALVLALLDPGAFANAFAGCPTSQADVNGDGAVDGLDIGALVQFLAGPQ